MSGPPLLFDRRAARQFRRRALSAGFPDFLNDVIGAEMADRLSEILRDFATVLIHRARPGSLVGKLRQARPASRFIISDVVSNADAELVIDEEALPFAPQSLDCIIWIMGLEQLNDIPGALIQIRRALRPDGVFLAAALAGDSLMELRYSFIAAESEMAGGVSPRISPFVDIREWGVLLQRAGFALTVADADRLTLRYADALALMRELKALGLSNPLVSRRRSLSRRDLIARVAAHYAERYADADDRIRATIEIVYLTGWAPHESQQQPLKPGSARQRLADALSTREIILKSND
ncbi:MAG: methyltransferase domain-containing protein [Rhizobiales bacterium]|nr:methyltransferase domain-containing protein [Hyphomicrobiales bacterium]